MTKYKYLGLMIELTRRCNLACQHCMRGDPQDVTISREVIDQIVENIEECGDIAFTGGEPLLALDELEYLVDRINKAEMKVGHISLVTNGTIADRRLIDIFKKFCDHSYERTTAIAVSNDRFHDLKKSRETYNFYAEAAKGIPKIKVILSHDFNDKKYNPERAEGLYEFTVAGRAKELVKERAPITPKVAVRMESTIDHAVCMIDDKVGCRLQINASGNVCLEDSRSYDTMDKLTLGNILEEPLSVIIQKHNSACLMTCQEVQLLEFWQNYKRVIKDLDIKDTPSQIIDAVARIAPQIIERVITTRRLAHEHWPLLPAQDIIRELPIPEIAPCYLHLFKEWLEHSGRIEPHIIASYASADDIAYLNGLKRAAKSSKDDNRSFLLQLISPTLGSAVEQIDTGEIERFQNILTVNALLRYPDVPFATDRFYGDIDVFTTPEFHRLKELDGQYKTGERENKAGNLVQCDPKQDVVNYLTAIMEAEMVRTIGDIISAPFKMPEFKLSEKTRRK